MVVEIQPGSPAEGCATRTVKTVLGEEGCRANERCLHYPGFQVATTNTATSRSSAPIGLMQQVLTVRRRRTLQLAGKRVVLLSGSHQRILLPGGRRRPGQAKAYPFMTPIFGEGECSTLAREAA